MNAESASSVKTLDKLVTILDSFTRETPSWSLADLSKELQIPKSSLHRLLNALGYHDLLRHSEKDERWRLGYRLFSWGNLVPEITGLRFIARPSVHDLALVTGESAILTIYDHHDVVCVDKEDSRHPVRLALHIGVRRHPHAGASSKILMAYLPDDEVRAIIQTKGLPPLSTNTITDPEILIREISKIREAGYALSIEETDLGAWGVAVPVWDDHKNVVASIGVAGPTSRYSEELARKHIEHCILESKKITNQVGKKV